MERTSVSWLFDTLNIIKGMIQILPNSQPNMCRHLQMNWELLPINIRVVLLESDFSYTPLLNAPPRIVFHFRTAASFRADVKLTLGRCIEQRLTYIFFTLAESERAEQH